VQGGGCLGRWRGQGLLDLGRARCEGRPRNGATPPPSQERQRQMADEGEALMVPVGDRTGPPQVPSSNFCQL
jgi:hypothetical protein